MNILKFTRELEKNMNHTKITIYPNLIFFTSEILTKLNSNIFYNKTSFPRIPSRRTINWAVFF